MNRKTGELKVQTAGGETRTVHVFTESELVTDQAGRQYQNITRRHLALDDGTPVVRVAKGKYQTVGETSVDLHSDDANAP